MQSSTQTRLLLPEAHALLLDRMGELFGAMKRKLYARVAAAGCNAKSHKTPFCREHGISALRHCGGASDATEPRGS